MAPQHETDQASPHAFEVLPAGASSHPAREAWLLQEIEQWFAGDLPDGRVRCHVVGAALRAASADAHRWLDERREGDELVRVDLHLDGADGARHSVFSSLPTPLALLLICLDQCRLVAEVLVVQEMAKAGRVEARATWPFGMDEAETLTRPAHFPAAVAAP